MHSRPWQTPEMERVYLNLFFFFNLSAHFYLEMPASFIEVHFLRFDLVYDIVHA